MAENWDNYTAIGYLKFALEHYNQVAANEENEFRNLNDDEVRKIIGCMHYAFDMKTLDEALEIGCRRG